MLLLEDFHGVYVRIVLFADHEDLPEGASPDDLHQVEIINGDLDGWVQDVLGLVRVVAARGLAEDLFPF